MPPAVSLVLPAFNEVENLEDAVAQARGPLAAIDPGWELLIVDDGSTDGTGPLADRIAAQKTWEGARRASVETLPEVLNNGAMQTLMAERAQARGLGRRTAVPQGRPS